MNYHLPARSAILLMLISLGCLAQDIEVVTESSSYSYIEDGKVAGPATQVVVATLKQAGLSNYRIALYPWARSYDKALLESDVLVYPMIRTPERELLFKWVGELTQVTTRFYKLREQHAVVASNLEQAKNFIVGVVRDDSRQLYLQAQNFTRLVVSANNLDNFHKLLNGQVQLVPMPESDAKLLCKETHIAFSDLEEVYPLDGLSARVYMAYSLATADDIVRRTTVAFNQLEAAGVVAELMDKNR